MAWTYNRLGMPDSALPYARAAWELDPQDQWHLAELMRTLWNLGRTGDVLDLRGLVRGGGPARYYAAASGDTCSVLWLENAARSGCDSAAADASFWLSLLASRRGDDLGALDLCRFAVLRAPDDRFYRAAFVERLARAGRVDEAASQLAVLRLASAPDQAYWSAMAALAEAEGDVERRVWASRRALETRWTAESAECLGWALVAAGMRSLRSGVPEAALAAIEEARGLAAAGSRLESCSDSLLGVLLEFEEAASAR